MNKFTATFASIAATLLLAGNAMAQMPAAGEGPFVEHQDYAAKRVQKTEVTRAPVSIKQVAVGEMNGIAKQTNDVNSPSRAEVRQETRDAAAEVKEGAAEVTNKAGKGLERAGEKMQDASK